VFAGQASHPGPPAGAAATTTPLAAPSSCSNSNIICAVNISCFIVSPLPWPPIPSKTQE
jgi:hypothetical protein